MRCLLSFLISVVVIGLPACGTPDDPTRNNSTEQDPVEAVPIEWEDTMGHVVIQNLRINVLDDEDWAGCPAVTQEDGACPIYEITFALQNQTDSVSVDRVTGVTLNLNKGNSVLDVKFTCDKVPWFIEPGSSSTVIDIAVSYGGAENSDPQVSLSCGQAMDSPDSFERREFEYKDLLLGPSGPTSGAAELRLEGMMGDASLWRAKAETTL